LPDVGRRNIRTGSEVTIGAGPGSP
jgi:hypothetical protein